MVKVIYFLPLAMFLSEFLLSCLFLVLELYNRCRFMAITIYSWPSTSWTKSLVGKGVFLFEPNYLDYLEKRTRHLRKRIRL